MNVDSIQVEHWNRLSTLTLPLAQELRKKWMRFNCLSAPGYVRPLDCGGGSWWHGAIRNPDIASIEKQVSDTFYSQLYSKMTAGLSYALNLPGEPDASWESLVRLWNEMAQKPSPAETARWVPQKQRPQCRNCKKSFGTFTRPHNCRLCGEVFCDNCTKKRMDILNPLDAGATGRIDGLQTKQRVCDKCYSPPAGVQIDRETGISGARLWHNYNPENPVSRFQFVVTEGGGIVLLNRLSRAFQLYFDDHPEAQEAFHGWKIFGERAAKGRSDSCVVYLCAPHRDARVERLWNHYILASSDLKRSIATSFIAPGLFPMGNGAWAIDLPDQANERRVLNKVCGGSAGGLIADVLGAGFARAADFFHDKPDEPLTMEILRDEAKGIVRDLVASLYHGESNRRRNRMAGFHGRQQNRMGTRLT